MTHKKVEFHFAQNLYYMYSVCAGRHGKCNKVVIPQIGIACVDHAKISLVHLLPLDLCMRDHYHHHLSGNFSC